MGRIISRPRRKNILGNLPFGFGLAACKRLQRGTPCRRNRAGSATRCGNSPSAPPSSTARSWNILCVTESSASAAIASGIVIAVDRTLFQLYSETEHLLGIGDLARRKRRVHIHVPLQEEDTVGQLLAVTHFGDGNHPHLFGKILVTGIFEMDMEIHVLERGGNLFSQSIVQ